MTSYKTDLSTHFKFSFKTLYTVELSDIAIIDITNDSVYCQHLAHYDNFDDAAKFVERFIVMSNDTDNECDLTKVVIRQRSYDVIKDIMTKTSDFTDNQSLCQYVD